MHYFSQSDCKQVVALGKLNSYTKFAHHWYLIGASLSEPHTIVVYGTTCIDRLTDRPINRPTDRPCPSHSRDTDTLHVPTLPSRNATLMSDM